LIDREECPICKRLIKSQNMTYHHWKPQSYGGKEEHTMRICETCHQTLHYIIPLHEVENYKTPEQLTEHAIYRLYVHWIRGIDHDKTIKTKKVIRYAIPDYVYHNYLKKNRKKISAA
jgi:hypothetical protein